LGWYTEEVIISYLVCEKYGKQGCHVEENKRAEGNFQEAVRRTEVVWMSKERKEEGGMPY